MHRSLPQLRRAVRAPHLAAAVAALLAGAATPPTGVAQQPSPAQAEVTVGSEMEAYLRYLQTLGTVQPLAWSVRGFTSAEVDRLMPAGDEHPWAERFRFAPDSTDALRFGWVHPEATAIYNSAFPWGGADGPVWAGRGLTAAVQGGAWARWGPLSARIAPIAFHAANQDFDLAPNRLEGDGAYRDPRFPGNIDLPQRFGDEPYSRIDPGESYLRLEIAGVAAGVSTAAQAWGPADRHPLLLGNNAGGFPHAFLGTSGPLDVWVGRLHGRLVWGRLDQSEYSPVVEGERRRFMTGLVAAFTPRWVPGLEVGVARFYHVRWPEGGPGRDEFLRPLEGFFKQGLLEDDNPDQRAENQLASAFARWVFPESRVEVFGEFVREDHSYGLRSFILEPDDLSGYLLGFRKAWPLAPDRLVALRAEVLNTETAHRERGDRGGTNPIPLYRHSAVRQGHTLRGQLLAGPGAYGGAVTSLGADYYDPRGRLSAAWSRTLRQDWIRGVEAEGPDVVHALAVDGLLFRRRFDLRLGMTAAYDLNRDLGDDAFSLGATVGAVARF